MTKADAGAEPPVSNRRPIRAIALNGALVMGSLMVAVALCEVTVRIVAPQQLILIRPDLWQPADSVGWLHRPNVDVRLNTGERNVRVRTDATGFRVGADGRTPPGTPILVLGDSFMEALQVDHEASFAGLLETALPALTGEPVAVRNAGMAGWGPSQYLTHARSLLPRDRYAAVITSIYLGNDIPLELREYLPPREHAERLPFRIPTALSWREVTRSVLRPINDFLEERSHLFLFFRNRLHTLRMQLGLAPLDFPAQFLKRDVTSARWAVTIGLCERIAEAAAQHGARALFVLIPAPFQVDSASLTQYLSGFDLDPQTVALDQPNQILTEGLTARGLQVVDVLSAFRAAHDRGIPLYGAVDPHLSPEGHVELARVVSPAVANLLRSPP